MFESFTDRARAALVMGERAAAEYNHQYLGCEHILVGLGAIPDGIAAQVLAEFDATDTRLRDAMLARVPSREDLDAREAEALATIGIDIAKVRETVTEIYGPNALPDWRNRPPFTPRAKSALEQSAREAAALDHWFIGTEHVLLGLLVDEENFAVKILDDLGVDQAELRSRVVSRIAPDVVRARELFRQFEQIGRAAQATDDQALRDRIHELRKATMRRVNDARETHHAERRAALGRMIASLESAWSDAAAGLKTEGIDLSR